MAEMVEFGQSIAHKLLKIPLEIVEMDGSVRVKVWAKVLAGVTASCFSTQYSIHFCHFWKLQSPVTLRSDTPESQRVADADSLQTVQISNYTVLRPVKSLQSFRRDFLGIRRLEQTVAQTDVPASVAVPPPSHSCVPNRIVAQMYTKRVEESSCHTLQSK